MNFWKSRQGKIPYPGSGGYPKHQGILSPAYIAAVAIEFGNRIPLWLLECMY
jgi:hypothetical protein